MENTTNTNTNTNEKSTKTNRKNKTKQVVNWPASTTFFTLTTLWKTHNPDFKEITLRTRLTKALETKTVALIGHLHVEKGRPLNVFALSPVTPQALEAAKQAEVVFASTNTTATTTTVGVVSVAGPKTATVSEPAASEIPRTSSKKELNA